MSEGGSNSEITRQHGETEGEGKLEWEEYRERERNRGVRVYMCNVSISSVCVGGLYFVVSSFVSGVCPSLTVCCSLLSFSFSVSTPGLRVGETDITTTQHTQKRREKHTNDTQTHTTRKEQRNTTP